MSEDAEVALSSLPPEEREAVLALLAEVRGARALACCVARRRATPGCWEARARAG